MRDIWYADNRDLIKWGVLFRLADTFQAGWILQVAFYRPSEFGRLVIDGQEHDIPDELIAHFRNLRTIGDIGSKVRVTVFDPVFQDRDAHLQSVLALLPASDQPSRSALDRAEAASVGRGSGSPSLGGKDGQ